MPPLSSWKRVGGAPAPLAPPLSSLEMNHSKIKGFSTGLSKRRMIIIKMVMMMIIMIMIVTIIMIIMIMIMIMMMQHMPNFIFCSTKISLKFNILLEIANH